MMESLINNQLYKWARAIDIGEGQGSTWPFGTQHVAVVFGMLGAYARATTPAARVAQVGN
jgi:hypothetical protein